LVQLELRPVHDALRATLDPAVVRMFADAVETPPVQGTTPEKRGKRQSELLDTAWGRCEELLASVLPAWARLSGERAGARPIRPESLAPVYRKCLRSAMRLLTVEALIPPPLSAAARRVLPNSSPDVPATALWGPVMSWCLLQTLALAIDEDHLESTALDLFDRLRLREPLAQAFQALGMEGERGWRAAARLKILLMIEAGVGTKTRPQPEAATPAAAKLEAAAQTLVAEAVSATPTPVSAKPGDADGNSGPKLVIPAALWKDPDVRWLTGHNEAEGHTYVIREPYEELLWWLSLPSLLKLANMTLPTRNAASPIAARINEALAAVKKAGYRVDALLQAETVEPDAPVPADPAAVKVAAVGLEPEEAIAAKPVHPVDPDGPPEDY
jgi:hypothetical protein